MNTNTPDEEATDLVGGVLVGAEPIKAYLITLGMPETTDPYYLRKTGKWPIGSRPRRRRQVARHKAQTNRHVMKSARGTAACLLAILSLSLILLI